MAKMSIVGGLLPCLAVLIAEALFNAGGMPTIKSPGEQAIVQTHAGDDSDGKIWGIEGMNILLILAGLILSVGLSMMLFRQQAHSPSLALGLAPYRLSSWSLTCLGFARESPSTTTPICWKHSLPAPRGCQPPAATPSALPS